MRAEDLIRSLAARVKDLGGWRRRGAAFAAGSLSVLAMAPFFAWPILWITLPVLVWLIDGAVADGGTRWWRQPAVRAAEIGWWFGFGYFLFGLFWIGEAFLVEAEVFAVLLPFAVTLLPAGLALFFAAATGIASRLWRPGPSRVLALALALSATEWLRGHVLTGFPWNVLGYALTYPLPLMQSAAVLGIYGLTLCAVIIFALPPVLWSEAADGPAGRGARRSALAVAVVPLLLAAVAGQVRLALAGTDMVPGVKIRIVQPSVPQREKWRPENQARIFQDHLDLSARDTEPSSAVPGAVTHLVWPEAAMPFLPLDHAGARAAIGRLLPAGTFLITGALRAEPSPPGSPRPRRIFNSLLVFGEGGSLTVHYDKIHLVPFGEYLPFQSALEAVGLQQLVGMRGGFDVGVAPRPLLQVPGLPSLGPLICYEAIFPHAVVQGTDRPSLLINVTNDGWFGNTTGPRQHFHQARVRAVEEGLPLIRAANNGISAAVDGYGRVLAQLDMNVRGFLDVPLPVALATPVYARLGDWTFLALWLVGAAILVACTRRPH
jgi:apolipoprotein N-acyltransferase